MNRLLKGLLLLVGMIAFPVLAAVNINTATQSQLEAVRGLGPAKAKSIIEYREANGSFKALEDLDKVKGFGKATIEKLRSELSVETAKSKP